MRFPKEHTRSSSSFVLTAGTGALGTVGTRSSEPSGMALGISGLEPGTSPERAQLRATALPWNSGGVPHVSRLGTHIPMGTNSPEPLLRLRFPLVFVNSGCSRLLRVVSELHKRFYQKWTRFKSKYSSYVDLFPGKGNMHWEGNSFLTTGLGDSVCRRLPTAAAHTFPLPLAHEQQGHPSLTHTASPASHALSVPTIHNNVQ